MATHGECPVCGASVAMHRLNAHVNACLDGPGGDVDVGAALEDVAVTMLGVSSKRVHGYEGQTGVLCDVVTCVCTSDAVETNIQCIDVHACGRYAAIGLYATHSLVLCTRALRPLARLETPHSTWSVRWVGLGAAHVCMGQDKGNMVLHRWDAQRALSADADVLREEAEATNARISDTVYCVRQWPHEAYPLSPEERVVPPLAPPGAPGAPAVLLGGHGPVGLGAWTPSSGRLAEGSFVGFEVSQLGSLVSRSDEMTSACAPQEAVKGSDWVYSMTVHPTEPLLFVGMSKGLMLTLKYVRQHDGCEGWAIVQSLREHSDVVRAMEMSSNGVRLLTGGGDKSLRCWKLTHNHKLYCEGVMLGHTSNILCIAVKRRIACSGGFDKTIRVWSLQSFQCLQTLTESTAFVRCLSFCGDALLSGGNDRCVRRYEGFTQLSEFADLVPSVVALLLCRRAGARELLEVPLDVLKLIVAWVWCPPFPARSDTIDHMTM